MRVKLSRSINYNTNIWNNRLNHPFRLFDSKRNSSENRQDLVSLLQSYRKSAPLCKPICRLTKYILYFRPPIVYQYWGNVLCMQFIVWKVSCYLTLTCLSFKTIFRPNYGPPGYNPTLCFLSLPRKKPHELVSAPGFCPEFYVFYILNTHVVICHHWCS